MEQTAQAFKVLLEWTGNMHVCTICEINVLVGGPWKVLKKGLQFFEMNPGGEKLKSLLNITYYVVAVHIIFILWSITWTILSCI